jgi:hypothetical protein
MLRYNQKNIPLFYYLGFLQIVTALCGGIVFLLFIKFAEGPLFDFILSFLPDVSLKIMSIVGLFMLLGLALGNFIGAGFSFWRSDSAGFTAIVIGGAESPWMIYQYFILHMHNILIPLFFVLSYTQLILGYLLREWIIKNENI